MEFRGDELVVLGGVAGLCTSYNPVVVILRRDVLITGVDTIFSHCACGIENGRGCIVEVSRPCVLADDGGREGQAVVGSFLSTVGEVADDEVASEGALCGCILSDGEGFGLALALNHQTLFGNLREVVRSEAVGQGDALQTAAGAGSLWLPRLFRA